MNHETVLSIPGMACQDCVSSIGKALEANPGVSQYDIDLPNKTARIESTVAPDELISAIKLAGYEATVLK